MSLYRSFCSLVGGFFLSLPVAAADTQFEEFTQRMVSKHQFEAGYIENALAGASKNQKILDAIARPWEAKPWYQYRPIFIKQTRIDQGVEFWQENQAALEKAEKEFGVPAEIIVAIIGVETFYGKHKGVYPVLDALYTLGFYYPKRAKFFRSELEQFLILSREEGWEITQPMGSYAGAMGLGQFISSSYRHYAIDFDGDGKRDLFNNTTDAIGSVANYFSEHGWKSGEAVTYATSVSGEKYQALLEKALKPRHQPAELASHGVELPKTTLPAPVKLLKFELEEGHEYWIALHNFYVITRYNHSPLYAMAVYQLSQEIAKAKAK
ncbi:lytic murein transglycosylase B [Corallincola luteus]|uniref:Lytic murein transglycosylase B n=1 Tax=Corallincola luteus TaxID=1775177 RepID=A0ABY2AJJ0_9GAMM|nr:lytic murein transglycosylase B [Corallincola luteus]TCI02955.1 lytic murein transglycosylase B [Corallincola luteus]